PPGGQPPTPPPSGPTPPGAGGGPSVPPPPPGYGQQPSQGAPQPLSDQDDKMWAMLSHFGGVLFLLPPLIIWLVFRERGRRTDTEGKEAVNWQITFLIVFVAVSIVVSILSAIIWFLAPLFSLLTFAVYVINVVFCVLGGMRVNAGGTYQYPINIRFIK
ncbi:DUF4870 domain-containing protein, partial [Microbacterium sp. Ld4]|uniref:DUF4870 domain-containing protein n=2 Tax=unclassified Microbacterium TaxID=2609290 RepID=UPI0038664296